VSTIRIRLRVEIERQRSVDGVIIVDRVGRGCETRVLPRCRTTLADFPLSSRTHRRPRPQARGRRTRLDTRRDNVRLDADRGLAAGGEARSVAGGEARSVAAYRRSYDVATGHGLCPSSFYDRFTDAVADLLGDLLEHAIEEVAVPHHLAPAFDRFRDVIATDATIARLHRFLSEFPATHEGVSGLQLYLVHHVTEQSVISAEITDERTYESTLFKTGSWMCGRLFLLDLGFFKYRRFALIDKTIAVLNRCWVTIKVAHRAVLCSRWRTSAQSHGTADTSQALARQHRASAWSLSTRFRPSSAESSLLPG